MRFLPAIIVLTLALGGCSTIRKGLGEYQAAADKGIGANLGGRPVDEPAPGGDAPRRANLPTGLGGDKANAEYTAPQG